LVSAALQLVAAFDPAYMLCLVNQERAKVGKSNLGLDDRLNQAAQEHCNFQASVDSMTHSGDTGDSPGTRMTQFGFNWVSCAENISFGQSDEQDCMREWMASPGHRANILGDYTHFGAAVGDSGPTPFYTQDFASDGQQHDFPACPGGDSSGGDSGDASSYGTSSDDSSSAGVTWYDEDGNQVAAPSDDSSSSYGSGASVDDGSSDGGVEWFDEDGNQVAAPSSGGDDDSTGEMVYD